MNNKWLVAGLIISVVLNLLLVGFMVGRASGGPLFPGGRMDPTTGYVRLLHFLPEERREAIAPIVRPMLRELMPALRSMRGDHRSVHEALAADPFDPDELSVALETLREHLNTSQATAHTTLVALARSLSAEERTQLAEAMRRPPRPSHRGDMKGRGWGPGGWSGPEGPDGRAGPP
jgi:uncharacterized membrane protein